MLGIAILAVIVITVTWQAISVPTVPEAVKTEHEVIAATLSDLIRAGTADVIKDMEAHGGYLSLSYVPEDQMAEIRIPRQTVFLKRGVKYWTECGNTTYPEMDEILSTISYGVTRYLKENLNETDTVFGEKVRYDMERLSVTANVLDNQVSIVVNLPTTIGEHLVTAPYTASVPTQFGRIYQFARDFSEEESKERFWEKITTAGIITSPNLPTSGIQVRCGDVIYLSPRQVSDEIKKEIRRSLVNTELWSAGPSGPRSYNINTVNGKQYKDLDISFWLPDDFDVPIVSPVVIVNAEPILSTIALPFMAVPICFNRYIQTYSFPYPVIVRIRDSLLGSYFHFANLAYIDRLEPGECASIMALQSNCSEPGCTADITVKNSDGAPIEGAFVSFQGCTVGHTDMLGNIVGQVKCGSGKLKIIKPGYSTLGETRTHPSLNTTFTLNRIPKLEVYIYRLDSGCRRAPVENEMAIINLEGPQNYMLNTQDPEFDTDSCLGSSKAVCDECKSTQNEDKCRQCEKAYADCMKDSIINNVSLDRLSAGEYEVSEMVMNPAAVSQYSDDVKYGSFIGIPVNTKPERGDIPEQDGKVVVYVPDMDEYINDMIAYYESRYRHWKDECKIKILGICTKHYSSSEARAMALGDTTKKIKSFPDEFHRRVSKCLGGKIIKRA